MPFVVYADFESVLQPIHTATHNPDKSFTVRVQEHRPHSFAYYIKCAYDDSLSKFELYRGDDAARVFMQRLDADAKSIYLNHLKHIRPMKDLTDEEAVSFETASRCHICKKAFLDGDVKVKDHCHLSGSYRGAAHDVCNLNFQIMPTCWCCLNRILETFDMCTRIM